MAVLVQAFIETQKSSRYLLSIILKSTVVNNIIITIFNSATIPTSDNNPSKNMKIIFSCWWIWLKKLEKNERSFSFHTAPTIAITPMHSFTIVVFNQQTQLNSNSECTRSFTLHKTKESYLRDLTQWERLCTMKKDNMCSTKWNAPEPEHIQCRITYVKLCTTQNWPQNTESDFHPRRPSNKRLPLLLSHSNTVCNTLTMHVIDLSLIIDITYCLTDASNCRDHFKDSLSHISQTSNGPNPQTTVLLAGDFKFSRHLTRLFI